jgi:hypothetical protein
MRQSDRQKYALARPGVESVVCFGDVVQRHWIAGRYRECSLAGCGGDVDSGLASRPTREVVTAEESAPAPLLCEQELGLNQAT